MQIAKASVLTLLPAPRLSTVGIWLLVGTLSIFFGLLAVTAQPMMIGLGVGLVVGLFLLFKPALMIWLILLLGLSMGAFVSMLGPQFSKVTWAVSILGLMLLALSLFNLFFSVRTRGQPAFIWIGLFFLVLALATSFTQWHSSGEVIAGIKRIFQAYGLMFAFATLTLSAREIRHYQKLLLAIALLQFPFVLYEFFVLVPLRGGLDSNSSTTDVVAGTFGANMEGGSPNGVMAIFLLIILGFLFAHWKEKQLPTRTMVGFALPMLAVFFLGELKILFVVIPIAFLVLVKRDIPRRPRFFILMSLFGLLLIVLLGYLYSAFIIRQSVEEIILDTLAYNVQERGYGSYYLNRLSVLKFWWLQQGWGDPVSFAFGNGLGSAFSAPSLVPGHIAMKWPRHGIDLTTASSLLWDTGVMGLSLFILILLTAWHACNVLLRDSRDSGVIADATAIQAAIASFAVLVIYNDTLVNHPSMEIIMTTVLGYLAYLYRRRPSEVG